MFPIPATLLPPLPPPPKMDGAAFQPPSPNHTNVQATTHLFDSIPDELTQSISVFSRATLVR